MSRFLSKLVTLLVLLASSNAFAGPPVIWQNADAVFLNSGTLKVPGLGTGLVHSSSVGLFSSSAVNLAGADVTGTLPFANTASIPAAVTFYVDHNRVDSYTPDGSRSRPFLTIQAAINQVISNGDNSTKLYVIDIIGGGTYAENLTLNSTALVQLVIDGHVLGQVSVTPASGSSLVSTSNNANLAFLSVRGLLFGRAVDLTGDTTSSSFCTSGCFFYDSQLPTSTVNLTNASVIEFHNTPMSSGTYTQTNVSSVSFQSGDGMNATTTVTTNAGGNKPSGFSSSVLFIEHTLHAAASITIGAGSIYIPRNGARVGTSGGTFTNSGTVQAYNAFFRSNITNNASSTMTFASTGYGGTVTNSGTFTGIDKALLINSAVPATNAGVIVKDAHYKSTQTTAPTATVNGNAGTSATCALTNATDQAGTVTLVSGSAALVAGTQCTINFNKAWAVAPICQMSPANAGAAANLVQYQIGTTTTSVFPFTFNVAAVLSTTYVYKYFCFETQ